MPCPEQETERANADQTFRHGTGMKVAKANGQLRGKQPKLKPAQEAHLVELWRAGKHTSAELAELSVARSTVYRAVQRAGEPKSTST
jgi:DNA invertase Pin-like site-specific DNA recombinase